MNPSRPVENRRKGGPAYYPAEPVAPAPSEGMYDSRFEGPNPLIIKQLREEAEENKRWNSATPESDPEYWCKKQTKKAARKKTSENFWLNPSPNNLKQLSKKPFLCPKQFEHRGMYPYDYLYEFYKSPEEQTQQYKDYWKEWEEYNKIKNYSKWLRTPKPNYPDGPHYEVARSKTWPHAPLRKTIRGVLDYRINNENRKNLIPYKQRLLETGARPKTKYNPAGKAKLAKEENADYVRWDLWGNQIQDPRPKPKGGRKTRRSYTRQSRS
jgi:hypothetical protein